MRMTILKVLVGCCVLAIVADAQEARGQRSRGNAERHQMRREARQENPARQEQGLGFVRTEFRFGGRVVKHAPYSAEAVTESTQTLANGAKLSQKNVALVYRDGEGRTRREQSVAPIGPFAMAGTAQRVIFISDPVAGVAYTLHPDTRTAERVALPAVEVAEVIDAANSSTASPPQNQGVRHPSRLAEKGQTVVLGKREIEGLQADGERTTVVIPVGSIGNDQPLEVIEERWNSPDLRIVLRSKTSDPRWGETTYQLTRITRGEPDATLFVVPSNYVIQEGRAGEPKPRAGRRRGARPIR